MVVIKKAAPSNRINMQSSGSSEPRIICHTKSGVHTSGHAHVSPVMILLVSTYLLLCVCDAVHYASSHAPALVLRYWWCPVTDDKQPMCTGNAYLQQHCNEHAC